MGAASLSYLSTYLCAQTHIHTHTPYMQAKEPGGEGEWRRRRGRGTAQEAEPAQGAGVVRRAPPVSQACLPQLAQGNINKFLFVNATIMIQTEPV